MCPVKHPHSSPTQFTILFRYLYHTKIEQSNSELKSDRSDERACTVFADLLAVLRDHSCFADLLNFHQSVLLPATHRSGPRHAEIMSGL